MSRRPSDDRRLPVNAKAIQKAVKATIGRRSKEFRITGVRGLVLHVLSSGCATWYFHYDVELGKTRRRRKLKLGRVDDVSLADAISEAERMRPLIRAGADPVAQKTKDRHGITFAELTNQRMEKGEPLGPGTRRDYGHILKKDILPIIGAKPAKAVSRDDIITILDLISNRGASRRADTARAVVSSIFSFALDRGLVEANPAAGLRNRHDYEPRDVIASEADIRRLWSAMATGEAAMSPAVANVLRLALLTGLRRTEIAAARKSELELDVPMPVFTIPRGRAKNRTAHRVPLSPRAADIFRQAVSTSGDSEFAFPGERGAGHIAARSVSKAMERTRRKIRINDVTVHDLRRTAGTFLSRLGVPKFVRERILNHGGSRKGNLTDGVYNVYEFDAEKRAALELWADALAAIIDAKSTEIDNYAARLAHVNGIEKIKIGNT